MNLDNAIKKYQKQPHFIKFIYNKHLGLKMELEDQWLWVSNLDNQDPIDYNYEDLISEYWEIRYKNG